MGFSHHPIQYSKNVEFGSIPHARSITRASLRKPSDSSLRDDVKAFIFESLATGGKTVQELSNAISKHFNRPVSKGRTVNVLTGLIGKPKNFFLECNYLRVTQDGPGGGFVELA
mmetsp:Transcript_67091/g.105526  ORF Transcript_67091/g.105526 Transcript_67091/m.105526 type:complete len:114 (+) Transcript_67091:1-342(+)